MEKQPILDMVSGKEALDQLRQYPHPQATGILHVPNQLTWPLLVPAGGLAIRLDPNSETELTYGLVTGIIAFEEDFHLLGRVDCAYGEQEETVLFRLDWNGDREMIESIAELGIVGLTAEAPKTTATREELADYLGRVTTFVCQLEEAELHRLRIQMIRMQAQEQFLK
jgi:hypothetical protein